ncbi:LysR substrate-binding domain-containing protein [Enterovibrio nigricans]|uniref:LysR substrate binding domain-containing protein n=1 Tax=Enterovibrio nigricans DSM 22720 TaxID=1121868 RepID=A0A1T4VCA4_9GAMM|nr:LysR substrate binding domain-containing protein [Enterovibrio nigricans DSM 22720]
MQTTMALIESGYGVGILPDFVVRRNNNLQPCLPDHDMPLVNVYAIHPFHSSAPIGVRMAIDAIEKALFDYVNPLST